MYMWQSVSFFRPNVTATGPPNLEENQPTNKRKGACALLRHSARSTMTSDLDFFCRPSISDWSASCRCPRLSVRVSSPRSLSFGSTRPHRPSTFFQHASRCFLSSPDGLSILCRAIPYEAACSWTILPNHYQYLILCLFTTR